MTIKALEKELRLECRSSLPREGLECCTPRVVCCNDIEIGGCVVYGQSKISIHWKSGVLEDVRHDMDGMLHD